MLSWIRTLSLCAAALLLAAPATHALEITSPGAGLVKLDFTRGPNFGGNNSANDCDGNVTNACVDLTSFGTSSFNQAADLVSPFDRVFVPGFGTMFITVSSTNGGSGVSMLDSTDGLLMDNTGTGTGNLHIGWNFNPIGGLVPPGRLVALTATNVNPADDLAVWYDGAQEFAIVTDTVGPLPASMGATPITSMRLAGSASRFADVDGPLRIEMLTIEFVPEPGTAMLLGMGIAGLAFAGRTRRARV